MRESFAAFKEGEMRTKGADLRTVQEFLGHSTLALVERYSHVSNSTRKAAIQLLGRQVMQDAPTIPLREPKRVVEKVGKA